MPLTKPMIFFLSAWAEYPDMYTNSPKQIYSGIYSSDNPTGNTVVLERITELANQEENIETLWLYGSRAKGNAREDSDYDLAVIFKSYEVDPLIRRTRPELLAMDWIQKLGLGEGELSVLDLEIAPIPLSMSVLTTGSQLVSKNRSREFYVTQKIMSKWEIDYQYHYKHYG